METTKSDGITRMYQEAVANQAYTNYMNNKPWKRLANKVFAWMESSSLYRIEHERGLIRVYKLHGDAYIHAGVYKPSDALYRFVEGDI